MWYMHLQGMPVLHLAATLGNLQIVQHLLSHGSILTARDQQVSLSRSTLPLLPSRHTNTMRG